MPQKSGPTEVGFQPGCLDRAAVDQGSVCMRWLISHHGRSLSWNVRSINIDMLLEWPEWVATREAEREGRTLDL